MHRSRVQITQPPWRYFLEHVIPLLPLRRLKSEGDLAGSVFFFPGVSQAAGGATTRRSDRGRAATAAAPLMRAHLASRGQWINTSRDYGEQCVLRLLDESPLCAVKHCSRSYQLLS